MCTLNSIHCQQASKLGALWHSELIWKEWGNCFQQSSIYYCKNFLLFSMTVENLSNNCEPSADSQSHSHSDGDLSAPNQPGYWLLETLQLENISLVDLRAIVNWPHLLSCSVGSETLGVTMLEHQFDFDCLSNNAWTLVWLWVTVLEHWFYFEWQCWNTGLTLSDPCKFEWWMLQCVKL